MERITGVPAEEAVGLPYNGWLAGKDHDGRADQGHGGRVRGHQRAPRGSTLTVRLPVARRAGTGEDRGPSGRDRPEDGPPPATRARRADDPLCRCS